MSKGLGSGKSCGSGFHDIKDLLTDVVDHVDTQYHRQGRITGVATGFSNLDEMTAGLQSSELVVIAGRPSMGKTTLAMNIAQHVTTEQGIPTAIFTLSVPARQLIMRMLSAMGSIDQGRLRKGLLDDNEWSQLTLAVSRLSEAPMYIDDTDMLTPGELRVRARNLFTEARQGLIIIDELQRLCVPGCEQDKARAIGETMRAIKALAKELDIPVVVLSQLNRNLERRHNKRPLLSDLNGSDVIEQEADVVVFIYRDELYYEDSPDKGMAELMVSRQRNGPLGNCRLRYFGQYARFEDDEDR